MRNLQTKDLFSLVRVIKEIGVREEIKKVVIKQDIKNVNEIGIDLLFSIIERATEKKAESKIYEFISGPLECSPKEIETMDPLKLIESLSEVANINKWKDFLSKAAQLMK